MVGKGFRAKLCSTGMWQGLVTEYFLHLESLKTRWPARTDLLWKPPPQTSVKASELASEKGCVFSLTLFQRGTCRARGFHLRYELQPANLPNATHKSIKAGTSNSTRPLPFASDLL